MTASSDPMKQNYLSASTPACAANRLAMNAIAFLEPTSRWEGLMRIVRMQP